MSFLNEKKGTRPWSAVNSMEAECTTSSLFPRAWPLNAKESCIKYLLQPPSDHVQSSTLVLNVSKPYSQHGELLTMHLASKTALLNCTAAEIVALLQISRTAEFTFFVSFVQFWLYHWGVNCRERGRERERGGKSTSFRLVAPSVMVILKP